MTTQQLIQNVIQARAKEIVDFVEMDMPMEWAVEYVKNSTTLSAQSLDQAVALAKETIEARAK